MRSNLRLNDGLDDRLTDPPQETFRESLAVDLRLVEPVSRRNTATHFRRAVVFCEVLADILTITFAVTLGCLIYYVLKLGRQVHYPTYSVLEIAFAFAVGMVFMLDRAGAYARANSLLRVRETEQVLQVSAQAFLIVMAVSFFSNFLFSRWMLVLSLALVPLALFVQKSFLYLLIHTLHSKGYGVDRVLIYGSGSTGRRVFSALTRSPRLGLHPIAFVDDDPSKTGGMIFEMGYEPQRSAPVVKGPISGQLISAQSADLVIIAIPSISPEVFQRAVEGSFDAKARVSFVPSHFLPSDPAVVYQDIDGVLLASLAKPAQRFGYEVAKRIVDLVVAAVLLLLGLPLFLLLAVLIRIDSPGAVIFRQERIGLYGKLFRMFKFRTMHPTTDPYELSPQISTDPRITRLGRFLRRTSLDELPQLLNVLQGSMSLVGPRPEMPFIAEKYTQRHKQRLQVKPGLTGLWQLSGDRNYLIHENIEYDLYYLQHRSFFMDLAILLHTTIFAMRGI
jgi:exopolysaccharide biosynthesis polyprenyl glycosylphosphotransferase